MQAFKNILIPTDFSPVAWKAVQLGLSIARNSNIKITLLHVYPSTAKFIGISNSKEDDETAAQLIVKKQMQRFFGELALENATRLELEVTKGMVDVEIQHFLESGEFDLVIVGINSHDQNNIPGSNTGSIISHSSIPVLVIPNNIVESSNVSY